MKQSLVTLVLAGYISVAVASDRYEAESAVVDENSIQKVADAKASGGFYINMKEGSLSFKITAAAAGFYTLWASYSQPNDTNGKIQNLSVNGVSTGQISFPKVDSFMVIKASSKIKLKTGSNTIDITKSWGWVNIDYIELTAYEAVPFTISGALVTPNASINAVKMFGFIRDNFQKKVISGVMTNTVMQNDGHYTPNTVETQTEVAWIINASGKTPALLGLDFMHSAGISAEDEWFKGYTNATVALAKDIYKKGGFPAYCWHWKDPSHTVDAFYSPSSGNTPNTNFNLTNAFTDPATCTAFNTSSVEYKGIIRDLDIVAGYLKTLADEGVPILWRPLHESSGKWFWWGYSGPKACKALYRLMFDRFTKYHGLNNLIWVWTTDEAGDALSWYPGDDCVDIIGRDYYFYPREANHGSLVSSFEKLKEMYGGKKIIALSENGSVPYPDDMKGDGAGWSYFMPWYGDYTMDGWAHDNTAADWDKILNNNYVMTLDEMPGWDKYTVHAQVTQQHRPDKGFSINYIGRFIELALSDEGVDAVELYNSKGTRIATLRQYTLRAGVYRFDLSRIAKGIYVVKVESAHASGAVARIMIK
jgi:mannan endo-1,4-beta-mannosidase